MMMNKKKSLNLTTKHHHNLIRKEENGKEVMMKNFYALQEKILVKILHHYTNPHNTHFFNCSKNKNP